MFYNNLSAVLLYIKIYVAIFSIFHAVFFVMQKYIVTLLPLVKTVQCVMRLLHEAEGQVCHVDTETMNKFVHVVNTCH